MSDAIPNVDEWAEEVVARGSARAFTKVEDRFAFATEYGTVSVGGAEFKRGPCDTDFWDRCLFRAMARRVGKG